MYRMRRQSYRISAAVLVAFCLSQPLATLQADQEPAGDDQKKSVELLPPPPSDWERLVYLPYKNLKQVFEKEGAAVFMPYGKFLKMWAELRPANLQTPPKPLVAAVISQASYTGKIDGDVAKIEASFTVQVLGKAWAELPVQFGEAAVGKLTSGDEKVLLQGTGNGTYSLLFPKAGEHKLTIELSARVRSSPDGRSIELDCPPSGITTFDLTVPAKDQTIELTPQGVATPQSADDQTTRVKANLGSTKKISARWRPRLSAAPAMEALTSVQNTLELRIADGLVHTHATLIYQVLRGKLDQVRIAVPLDHRVLDVASAGIKSWKVTKEEKIQVVTVDLLAEDAKSITVEVHTERPLPEGAFALAGVDDAGNYRGIHALGELRENGILVIGTSADLALAVQEQSGLVRIEAAEVPEALRRPESQFYRYYTPKFRMQVTARPVEPRLLVDAGTQLVFREDEIQLVSQFAVTVERAGVFALRFRLPEGLKIDRVDCEQMKEFQRPEDADELIVSLRERTLGRIVVAITGHRAFGPAEKDFWALPLIAPEEAARENGLLFVLAPDSLEIITDEKGVQGAQPLPMGPSLPTGPGAAPGQPQPPRGDFVSPFQLIGAPGAVPAPVALQPAGGFRLASAWSYTRHPEIKVRTERKPTRLTASVATSINVKQDVTEVATMINYQVLFAGIDTFRFAVPESVAASVQIESADPAGAPIKQKSRADEVEEGWVVWTVVMQRDVSAHVPIRVRYDLKPEQKDRRAEISVEPLRVLETPGKTAEAPAIVPAAVSGEIMVQKDRALSVSAQGDELEPIDVRELTLLPQDGNLAYRYFKQPAKLSEPLTLDLSVTRYDIESVVETVVSQALIEAIVTDDKVVTCRARYRLKTSERQRLAIDLPKDAEVLDASLSGKRADLERDATKTGSRDREAFKINVARPTPSDEPFVVALVFRVPFRDSPVRGLGGKLSLPLPKLGGEQGSAVAVQQLRTVAWAPKDFTLVGSPRDFSSELPTRFNLLSGAIGYSSSPADVEKWFGDSPNAGTTGFAFTPAGRAYVYGRLGAADAVSVWYWKTSWVTLIISGSLVLIGLILAHTSWENRLTIVLLVAFGCAMYALHDADQMINGLAAARWGLLAMVAYWVIHALGRPRAQPQPSPSAAEPAVAASAAATTSSPAEQKADEKSGSDTSATPS
jgi:hypothetical protein